MTDGERLLDTNVLVHDYVWLDEKKQVTASAIVLPIWETGGGITTLQNLCEFFAVATKKVARPMPLGQAENIVREILSSTKWRVLDRREETVVHAMELVRERRAPFWDALIAACMLENGIEIIVTENERDFKRIPGITVTNPFRTTLRK
jgi:predicted nucleic acid-binding protein